MEYIVVMRRDNLYTMARFDSAEDAARVLNLLVSRGLNARMLERVA